MKSNLPNVNRKLESKRQIVREYIQNNPHCTTKDVARDTKIKIERVYRGMKDAYRDAGIKLSKNLTKRKLKDQRCAVIEYIKCNPTCTVTEIQNRTKVNVSRTFGSILTAYEAAGVEYMEKEVTSDVRNPKVVVRCIAFERKIIDILYKLGAVEQKVRTPSGITDRVFRYNEDLYVVEIKDYRGRSNITMSEIKQLMRYMKELCYINGLIICPKQSFPKRKNSRNIYKDGLYIQILSEEDLRGCSINQLGLH